MPSGVSLTSLAYLTNPRQVGKSKVWFFDANMFLRREAGEEGERTVGTCGALRYFNSSDLEFDDEGVYVIHAWVCPIGLSNLSYDVGENANKDLYDFVGDIQWLIPLHKQVLGEEAGEEPTIRLPKINMEYSPYVVLSGLPFNIDKPAAKFDIDIEQYTQTAKGGPMTVFPASCHIVDSPRWGKGTKPVPFPDKYVTASGYLTGVEDVNVPGSAHNRRFNVDVDNVIWLGNAPSATPATPAASSSSAGKRKQVFDSTPSWVKAKTQRTKANADAPSSSPSGSRN
ncbi:hypothetical protein C8F04DRAFT_1332779 [Mycena alexandri]|uniref:Uncharacterized protein n=1 Tax=Mycena alexandri TaxID=1745969 RepID=A0AAD6X6C6_9AGAR|nr:hypothetical protein C8F04DRAFT_1332779 [Mycena alexandri]